MNQPLAFCMTGREFRELVAFTRARCRVEHGEVEGERVFRTIPLVDALLAWQNPVAVA